VKSVKSSSFFPAPPLMLTTPNSDAFYFLPPSTPSLEISGSDSGALDFPKDFYIHNIK
jgi:hypothetical protein